MIDQYDPPSGPGSGRRNMRTLLVQAALLLMTLLVLYHHIFAKLGRDWYDLPDFGHGFLIPPFALYLVWAKRQTLQGTAIRPSWMGMFLILPALLLLLTGVFGADLFLSRFSFVLLVAGLIWTLLGKAMLGETKFILFVLLLAIPLPAVVFNQLTFPLQLFASRVASALLPLAGVVVLREGNIIQLPAMSLEVAEACSGIRSLMSLFTLAVIYGFFVESSTSKRVLLALASIPIAIAANSMRIFGTGLCVQYWNPDKAIGFFHEFSGWLMFLISLGCLYVLHGLMSYLTPKKRNPS